MYGLVNRAIHELVAETFGEATWEAVCAETVPGVWLTDCQSLHDYLVNPVAQGSEDKILEIDLELARKSVGVSRWTFEGRDHGTANG